jgi:hypothetical protein
MALPPAGAGCAGRRRMSLTFSSLALWLSLLGVPCDKSLGVDGAWRTLRNSSPFFLSSRAGRAGPATFAQFFSLLSFLAGRPRRTIWTLFLALAWAMWTTRNKLIFKRKILKHPADLIFKSIIFLQLWQPLAKEGDKGALLWMENELRSLHAALRPPSSGSTVAVQGG